MKKLNRAFDQHQDYFFLFETQNINTSYETFYPFIPIITETKNMEMCKRKCILCQFWNTLVEYF